MPQYFESLGATLQKQMPTLARFEKENIKTHLSFVEIDAVVNAASDIVDLNYRKWHCQCAYKLGRYQYLQIAAVARTSNQPQKMFSKMLKQALK